MDVSVFIAKRIAFNHQKSFSRFIIRLATLATAISVAAMIVASSFVSGFQNAISQKIFSFWGHIRIVQNAPVQSLASQESEMQPLGSVLKIIKNQKDIKTVEPFATQSAVIEFNKDIEGVLIKGVDKDYDFKNLQSFLHEGRWIDFPDSSYSKEIVLSSTIAKELKIRLHDTVNVYFISASEKASVRKLVVVGIYKTGIEEYDKMLAIGDIRLVRRINNWGANEIGGYEVFLHDYHKMDEEAYRLNMLLPNNWMSTGIKDVYPNIFDWLNIQDVNKIVIYVIMAVVAIINLITCLLILVLERMKMTGILKSLGSTDGLIQKIFLYHSSIIALRGVVYGFVFGIGLCLFQQYFGFIKLDESAYYIRIAPIHIVWQEVIIICVATFLICYAALILPTIFIKKIRPVRAIKFD
ncbi:MAG: ABC transporter permease [Arachidicoccus sp.]|nr:ABC transporter permease [Arachidicoccus sp.]